MSNKNANTVEPHLKIYKDRSILVDNLGREQIFKEGAPNELTLARQKKIMAALDNGFLEKIIQECKNPELVKVNLSVADISLLDSLVSAVTSEVGRAIVGLSILQLCVKAIEPSQNIRLHKAGRGEFSWQDGLSMRTLDSKYITPILRKHSLLRVNKDGIMMTRSLAENYPYSQLYKAAIRGAKKEWIELIDRLESKVLDAKDGLKVLIIALMRRSEAFLVLTCVIEADLKKFLSTLPGPELITELIKKHIDNSTYSARLMEIALHSLFQVHAEHGVINGVLKPLSQMRSANKKHGNVADIEVVSPTNSLHIIEAWDSKYGKPYLRDELDELSEKLEMHPETEIACFVVNVEPDLRDDITQRMEEIASIHNTHIRLLSFDSFVKQELQRAGIENTAHYAIRWLTIYVESLSQKRRELAPIDEPCDEWLQNLQKMLLI